jgi:Zn-dependent peptidase ImmA (M78 family)
MVSVEVRPRLLAWAQERSGLPAAELERKFPALAEWQAGRKQPTLRQLESFAQATHTPIGFLFLTERPDETLPLPDFRTMGRPAGARLTADLLDTVYLCQQRQDWYREFARTNHLDPIAFVGSLATQSNIGAAATKLRTDLNFEVSRRGSSWSEAFTVLRDQADDLGILVMVSGVVGSNTHRKLDPHEFRGFALVDDLAPLIFINGSDTKAAQIFTLTHELAHIWAGQSALDDPDLATRTSNDVESWCNQVAAEFLVPLDDLREVFSGQVALSEQLQRIAEQFRVSTLVAVRRVFDAGFLNWEEYRREYELEYERVMAFVGTGTSGGNFYNTQPVRVSKRFARAVIADTLEGQTLYTDAFRLLGFKKQATFTELSHRLAIA